MFSALKEFLLLSRRLQRIEQLLLTIKQQGEDMAVNVTKLQAGVDLVLKEVSETSTQVKALRDQIAALDSGDPAVQAQIDDIADKLGAAAKRLDALQDTPDLQT